MADDTDEDEEAGSGLSVADLLPDKLDHLDAAIERGRAQNPEPGKADLPAVARGVVGERVEAAVRQTLHFDVFRLLAEAWAKARELQEYADPAKHPPGETSTLFLGEHPLSVDVHPTVDVTISGLAKFELRFTLELEALLRLAEVTIKGGHITQIGNCDAELRAVLKYGEVPLHEPLKSRRVTLTKPIVLAAPGVAII
jgi:hypothetical protein